jgi:hypothetical protein
VFLLPKIQHSFCPSHDGKSRLRVYENRVLRRIFGPKREEVVGGWRRLHNEKFHNLYTSTIIIRVIKSRSMRWAGHVAHMGENKKRAQNIDRKTRRK